MLKLVDSGQKINAKKLEMIPTKPASLVVPFFGISLGVKRGHACKKTTLSFVGVTVSVRWSFLPFC